MNLLRTALALAFYLFIIPVAAVTAFPWTFISGRVDFLYRIGTWAAITGVRLAGVRIEVEGLDSLDQSRSYIFMSNHASNLDPPILVPLIPRRTSVLAKHVLFKIPLFGRALKLGDLVPVDRSNREAAIASLRRAAVVLRSGLNLTIFPEGTRSPDGRLLPFKKGPFYLAMDTGAPVVPVSIHNTHRLLPKGKFIVRGGIARVVFHPAIEPRQFTDRESLMEAVHHTLARALQQDSIVVV